MSTKNIVKLGSGSSVDTEKRTGRFRLMMPFGASYAIEEPKPEALAAMASLAASRKESLQGAEEPTDLTFDQVNPQETDYIFPLFRALSKAILPEKRFLDFSKGNVLKESVPLLQGQTIYTNHYFYNVERWVGVVNKAVWDEKGERVDGTPGINTELKIDWKLNPRIARGLLMKPPAIHSVSVTVLLDWDASHPDLLEKGIFWQSLGEEVDGQIVRIIVTKINAYWEMSLVFQGGDTRAKQIGDDEDEDELSASGTDLSLCGDGNHRPKPVPLTKKETTKVKLNDDRKKALGLTAHQGEEVEDAIVLNAVDSLAQRATSADAIVAAQRAEVLRLATLAEGVGEGDQRKLDPAITGLIEKADASQLPALTTLYQEKAQKAFPLTCEHGHPAKLGRSSVEQPDTVPEHKPATARRSNIL